MTFGKKQPKANGPWGAPRPARRLADITACADEQARLDPKFAAEREAYWKDLHDRGELAACTPRAAVNLDKSAHKEKDRGWDVATLTRRFGLHQLNLNILGPARNRQTVFAYIFWIFLSYVSAHRLYCGKTEGAMRQFFYLIGTLVMLALVMPIGVIMFLGYQLWVWSDLLRMPGMMAEFKRSHTLDADQVMRRKPS